jgi:hypothetical protein
MIINNYLCLPAKKLTTMLISLSRTYRGRTHKWWLQSGIIFVLGLFLLFLTYYFVNLYTQVQWLRAENKRLTPYIFITQKNDSEVSQTPTLASFNHIYEYLQYLNEFENFEKKAKLAKWMRVYSAKQVLSHQKNDLEFALTGNMFVPIMTVLGDELLTYSQQWDKASPLEKSKMHIQFKQRILVYEMVAKHQGHKILSSNWMRQMIIQSWYQFMRTQPNEEMPNYQELYPKLDSLVEFYFQMPKVENPRFSPDSALLEKIKNQLASL